MAVNLEQIELIIQELRLLSERLRKIVVTYRKAVAKLNLTAAQKQILIDEFKSVKQELLDKVAELP